MWLQEVGWSKWTWGFSRLCMQRLKNTPLLLGQMSGFLNVWVDFFLNLAVYVVKHYAYYRSWHRLSTHPAFRERYVVYPYHSVMELQHLHLMWVWSCLNLCLFENYYRCGLKFCLIVSASLERINIRGNFELRWVWLVFFIYALNLLCLLTSVHLAFVRKALQDLFTSYTTWIAWKPILCCLA